MHEFLPSQFYGNVSVHSSDRYLIEKKLHTGLVLVNVCNGYKASVFEFELLHSLITQ